MYLKDGEIWFFTTVVVVILVLLSTWCVQWYVSYYFQYELSFWQTFLGITLIKLLTHQSQKSR